MKLSVFICVHRRLKAFFLQLLSKPWKTVFKKGPSRLGGGMQAKRRKAETNLGSAGWTACATGAQTEMGRL